jgi:hypothetical protein
MSYTLRARLRISPLTLTLSLREREEQAADWCLANDRWSNSGMSVIERRRTILPLPKGEGRLPAATAAAQAGAEGGTECSASHGPISRAFGRAAAGPSAFAARLRLRFATTRRRRTQPRSGGSIEMRLAAWLRWLRVHGFILLVTRKTKPYMSLPIRAVRSRRCRNGADTPRVARLNAFVCLEKRPALLWDQAKSPR